MSEEKRIGRISDIYFGLGGYQDTQIGYWLTISGKGWGTQTGSGSWASEPSTGARWTVEERNSALGATCINLVEIMNTVGVKRLSELKDVPVEVTFDGTIMRSWRVLDEVLA